MIHKNYTHTHTLSIIHLIDMSIGNFNYPTSYEYFKCENKEKRIVINKANTGMKGANLCIL